MLENLALPLMDISLSPGFFSHFLRGQVFFACLFAPRCASRGFLPTKSPWLNPIEPKWVHGKRAVVEPDGLLSAQQLAERICSHFGCSSETHLSIPEKVA